ncbi:MAG: hypothetical protein AAFQ37_01660 [Bacteroidota bacterium]
MDYSNATLLFVAIEENDEATVSALLSRGAIPNVNIRKMRVDFRERLDWHEMNTLRKDQLRQQGDIRYTTEGWTPLMEAVEVGNAVPSSKRVPNATLPPQRASRQYNWPKTWGGRISRGCFGSFVRTTARNREGINSRRYSVVNPTGVFLTGANLHSARNREGFKSLC